MEFASEQLELRIAALIVDQISQMPASARHRIDNVSLEQARRLVENIRNELERLNESVDKCFYILSPAPEGEFEISHERAVELRNHDETKLLLFVPSGTAAAQSSLDNTFMKFPLAEYIAKVTDALSKEFEEIEELGTAIAHLKRVLKPKRNSQDWAEFLISSLPQFGGTLGENLWRLGLVPDLGPNPEVRLDSNNAAVKAISRPLAPSSSLDARLSKAGVQESVFREHLLSALSNEYLSNSKNWALQLLNDFRNELTFEKWQIQSLSPHTLNALTITSFLDGAGNPSKNSKLLMVDGSLLAPMAKGTSEELIGKIGLNWSTSPTKSSVVSKWRIELTLPLSTRDILEEEVKFTSITVAGSKRSALFNFDLSEDDLSYGKRFTVTISGLDENGQVLVLQDQSSSEANNFDIIFASAESQEFMVEVHDYETTNHVRQVDATSISEAKLTAITNGAAQDASEVVTWDTEGQILIFRYDDKYVSHIRTAKSLLDMQELILEDPSKALIFSCRNSDSSKFSINELEIREITLPTALAKARKAFLTQLGGQGTRGIVEAAKWDPSLTKALNNYTAAYKRALDTSSDEDLKDLLLLDTLSLSLSWGQDNSEALVTLATHPLRALWISKHSSQLSSWTEAVTKHKNPKQYLDLKLVSRLTPANLPFITIGSSGIPMVYQGELTFGTSLHIPATSVDSEALVSVVHEFLGFSREGKLSSATSSRVGDKIHDYLKLHSSANTLSVIATNPGDGAVMADAIRQALPTLFDIETPQKKPFPIEVQAFGNRTSFTNPLAALKKLQSEFRSISYEEPPSHLVPPFSLSSRQLSELHSSRISADVSLIQNLATTRVAAVSKVQTKAPYVHGLIIPTVVIAKGANAKSGSVDLAPALENVKQGNEQELTTIHSSHQKSISRALGHEVDSIPTLKVEVGADQILLLEELHEVSDWVMTLDRNAGLAIYEDVLKPEIKGTFLIDYAPDFIEGVGDRLTVTSTNRVEVEHILRLAMDDLNLKNLELDPSRILEILASVSGKLTMRLLEPNTLAREAVGLAALVAHMDMGGKLKDTIIIPVDAHPEIFHPATRGPGENGLRCDLILARVSAKKFELELVEVKARASAATVDPELNKHIADQLLETRRLLLNSVFALPEERPDSTLQWARALSLLHFYADRAIRNGKFSKSMAETIHQHINKLENNPSKPSISMAGYVVSMDEGDVPETPIRDSVRIKYLRAGDVRQLGQTTHDFQVPPLD